MPQDHRRSPRSRYRQALNDCQILLISQKLSELVRKQMDEAYSKIK